MINRDPSDKLPVPVDPGKDELKASTKKSGGAGRSLYAILPRAAAPNAAVAKREATEALGENDPGFRTLADTVPIMIWISGTDKLCTWFNRQWLNFVGRTLEQELGNGWVEGVHADDVARCFDTCLQGFDARLPFTRSFRLKRRDGAYRWVLDKAVPLFAPSGHFTGYMGCCIDITEQKQVEEALREADRRKDAFLANMSHEIRSPMTSILAYADILLSHLRDPDDIECVKTIKQGGNHLLELISDVLDLSKIGSGKLRINQEVVSLPTLLNEVHSLMAVRAKEKKLALILQYDGAVPEKIETDRTRLRQILFNLVSNAVKFTERGSVQIVARSLANNSALEVEVVDTGIGIAAEQQGRLFQPFVQADSLATREYEGTGLGLAITKHLVDILGGEISFESELTRGSKFRVRMPLPPARVAAAATPSGAVPAYHAAGHRIKILLVDDNQMVCRSMARLLEMSGHEVAVAFDGQSALEIAGVFQPEVFVLDLKLPDMSGHELLRRLKTLQSLQHTKSIALTGFGEEFRRNDDVEFDYLLTKPVDAKELETLLVL
jgi:PAS domain S-box-containing protein